MHIENIRLIDFKNYQDRTFSFQNGINCILGPNGSGKTTLLDAIHYLSITKSALNGVDSQNIRTNQSAFSIIGNFCNQDERISTHCIVSRGKKKVFRIDGNEYEKLSDHIGLIPVVLIAPDDVSIINDASEVRRRYFDSVISQTNKTYLDQLIRYHHILKQRNAYLKSIEKQAQVDHTLLDTYDPEIIKLSKIIYTERSTFLREFIIQFREEYDFLARKKESADIQYQSDAGKENFEEIFRQSREKDLYTQRTNVGVHRDKWNLTLNDHPLRNYGSQGQKKTFLLSLKLSQFEYIFNKSERLPILLLDDIFDKLDDHRIESLMEIVSGKYQAQILITDARPERTEGILNKLKLDANLISTLENKKHEKKK